jgi:hypothetical protein
MRSDIVPGAEAERHPAITTVYFKFEDLYGISRGQICEIVQKVKRAAITSCGPTGSGSSRSGGAS